MCECGCNNCDSVLSGLSGLLGALSPDYVYAGTVIEWRGYVFADGATSGTPTYLDYAGDAIEGCLYGTGGFDYIQLSESGLAMHEITIRVSCAVDFAHLADVFSLITGEIYNCAGMGTNTLGQSVISTPNASQGGTQPGPIGAPGGNQNNSPVLNSKCPAGYYDDSYFWQPVNCVPVSSASNPNSPAASKCPAGYYDNGWFSVNCVPVGTEGISKSTWVLIGAAAIGGLILVSKAR